MSGDGLTIAALLRERAAGSVLWLRAGGPSMGSRYGLESRVLVAPSTRRPRPGEVWAFVDRRDRVVVHRCVYVAPSGKCRFRGDAAHGMDDEVGDEYVVGRVVLVDDGVARWKPRLWHMLRPLLGTALGRVRKLGQRFCARLR